MNEFKTIHLGGFNLETVRDEEQDLSNTLRLKRQALLDPIKVQHRAYLEISWGGQESVGVELDKEVIVIGRHPACEISLPLTNVSRNHSRVVRQGDEYFIEDLQSTNGTYVNGVRVVRCVLRNNDQIQVGDARILFIEEKTRRQ